jgi:hypothetical protein
MIEMSGGTACAIKNPPSELKPPYSDNVLIEFWLRSLIRVYIAIAFDAVNKQIPGTHVWSRGRIFLAPGPNVLEIPGFCGQGCPSFATERLPTAIC